MQLVSFMLHSLHVSNVAIPKAFPLVTVTESTVSSEEAHFFLHLDLVAFIITNDNLVLSGGYGICGLALSPFLSLNVTCHGLSDGTSYNLTVYPSVDENCLIILISFDTPLTSPGMLPVQVNVLDLDDYICVILFLCVYLFWCKVLFS